MNESNKRYDDILKLRGGHQWRPAKAEEEMYHQRVKFKRAPAAAAAAAAVTTSPTYDAESTIKFSESQPLGQRGREEGINKSPSFL